MYLLDIIGITSMQSISWWEPALKKEYSSSKWELDHQELCSCTWVLGKQTSVGIVEIEKIILTKFSDVSNPAKCRAMHAPDLVGWNVTKPNYKFLFPQHFDLNHSGWLFKGINSIRVKVSNQKLIKLSDAVMVRGSYSLINSILDEQGRL